MQAKSALTKEHQITVAMLNCMISWNTTLVQNNSNLNPNKKTARQTAVKSPNDGGF